MATTPPGYEWRYTRCGQVRHLLRDNHNDSLCGLDRDWCGAGSQAEYERCAALPACKGCLGRVQPDRRPIVAEWEVTTR